jgi:hypothetical protein
LHILAISAFSFHFLFVISYLVRINLIETSQNIQNTGLNVTVTSRVETGGNGSHARGNDSEGSGLGGSVKKSVGTEHFLDKKEKRVGELQLRKKRTKREYGSGGDV